jgi:tetratricopeptide (TPR) repeat protein
VDAAWEALAEGMAVKIQAAADFATKTKLAEWVVFWARGPMRDGATADRFVAAIRTFDSTHPLVHERMATAYAEAGNWDSRREELERALARAEKPRDRCALHIALGELFEQNLPNAKLALEHFERAVAIDPRSVPALVALERICGSSEQFGRLAEILELLVDAHPVDRERTEALLKLAELLERHFLKPREAVLRYEAALAADTDSLRALDGLERCYHASRDWDGLASTLERRAAAARSTRDAIATLARLGEVREAKQENVAGAVDAWRRAYELDTSHVPAAQELARLLEKQGDVVAAAGYRARLADLTDDAREKARIHVAVGEMLAPEGRDPSCARIHFERAIEMDPRNASAWENLQRLATRDGDAMYATFCLERRAENAESTRLKGQLLVELANMRASLGDARGALATFEFAFETDPTNETAARAVLGEWVQRENWESAQRACDLLVAAATRDRDDATLFGLLRLSTRLARSLGNLERALLAATAAHELAPSEVEAREAVIAVCHELRGERGLRDRVRAAVESVARYAMDLPVAALVQIGEVRLASGDQRGGVEVLRLALAREGENRRALATLASAYLDQRDWPGAAGCQHSLARLAQDGAEQRALYLAAAEVWEKRARLPARAVAVLEEAHERSPRDTAVLLRLVALSQALGDWERLARALRWLADLEPEPERRAKHVYASAGVVREKIGDHARAATLYEEVLDLDPTRLDAFERLVRTWTDQRDWPSLDLAYTRMIARTRQGRDTSLQQALHHQLGLLLRDRVGDLPRALAAFRIASALAPSGDEDRRIVVELLLLMGDVDGAIAEMRSAVRVAPADPTSYQRLYELQLQRGAHDSAWCAANLLVHLGAANAAQRRFVEDFPPVELDAVPGTLASRAWGSHVLASGMDKRLTALFRTFVPAVVRARMGSVPTKNRMRWLGDQVRETDSPAAAALVRTVRIGAEILGVPPPMLLARPLLPVPFAVAPTPTAALFVSMPAVEAIPPELLVFLVGRRLAELRPELVARALFPTASELRTLLKTAVRVAVATPAAPPPNRDEAAIAAALEAHETEALRAAMSSVVGVQAHADVVAWLQLADLSASRAGLLLAGDFDVACRAMQREPRSPSALAPADWRREMAAFAISREYGELRDAIGVNVELRC